MTIDNVNCLQTTQNKINTVLVSASAHGNEMSGIAAIDRWKKAPNELRAYAPSTDISMCLVNDLAMKECVRYIDEDLNRQFSANALSVNKSSNKHEHKLAQQLNQQYGPKGSSRTDLIIDIHNTTSNMGPTLIILVNDFFHQQLARFVKKVMPEAIILIEDYQDYQDFAYFCTIGKRGIMIEVGPQPQGILRANAYQLTLAMTHAVLEFVERYNTGRVDELPPVDAFRLDEEIPYPTEEVNGVKAKTAMIHPAIEGKDFVLLKKHSPCFVDFEGNDILWDKPDTYPHFIGESAYDHLHLAFASANKILF